MYIIDAGRWLLSATNEFDANRKMNRISQMKCTCDKRIDLLLHVLFRKTDAMHLADFIQIN